MASNVLSNAFKRSLNKLTNAVGVQYQGKPELGNHDDFLSAETVSVLQGLPDSASLHTSNGDAIWVSQKSETILNQNIGSLIGKGFFEGANPQDKLNILKAFSDCDISGQNQSTSFRRQFPSSSGGIKVSCYELRISHFNHQEKSLYLALVRDITHEESKLTHAYEEIEKAKNSNSTKNLFLSNMSHELRTPLNAIIGFSQMLMGEAALIISEDKKTEYAGHINQSANHLLNIINDVLDLSKIEAGKFQIIPEIVNASEQLKSTLELMAPIASEANISINSDIADELPNIAADPRALRQIIINLVANAIKFSFQNSQIDVKLKRERRKICIEISDKGLGMSPEAVESLGNSFFQVEQTASRRFEGTGLGLSIVFGLIKLHNGNISFKSELHQGTTVLVELPISSQKSIPVPSDPDEAIVFLNKAREPNLLRKLDKNQIIRKVG